MRRFALGVVLAAVALLGGCAPQNSCVEHRVVIAQTWVASDHHLILDNADRTTYVELDDGNRYAGNPKDSLAPTLHTGDTVRVCTAKSQINGKVYYSFQVFGGHWNVSLSPSPPDTTTHQLVTNQ